MITERKKEKLIREIENLMVSVSTASIEEREQKEIEYRILDIYHRVDLAKWTA